MSQYHLLLESKKNDVNSFRAEIDSDIENKLMVIKEKWGRDKLEIWD